MVQVVINGLLDRARAEADLALQAGALLKGSSVIE
jgi:hypothetical protein